MNTLELHNQVKTVCDTLHDGCLLVEIMPTLDCPVGCPGCDRGTIDTDLADFNDVVLLYETVKKEFPHIQFRLSGGEPTLYPRINELIDLLLNLEPGRKIEMATNLLGFERLRMNLLDHLFMMVSVYPSTEQVLKERTAARLFFEYHFKKPIAANILEHEDLAEYGTVRKEDYDPLTCFGPVLLGGTKKIYPCCRAHRFEQMYGGTYHMQITDNNLVEGLAAMIAKTPLCSRCPRIYEDGKKIPTKRS